MKRNLSNNPASIYWGMVERGPTYCGTFHSLVRSKLKSYPQFNILIHSYAQVIHIMKNKIPFICGYLLPVQIVRSVKWCYNTKQNFFQGMK